MNYVISPAGHWRIVRLAFVAVGALGAGVALVAPDPAFASSPRPTPSAIADASPETCAAAGGRLTFDRRLDAGQPVPPEDPYEECYKGLTNALLAPFANVLPDTCLGKLEQIFLTRMISATDALAAISVLELADAQKAQRLAIEWKRLRARAVFLDALVDLVKASPSCAELLLPGGAALELIQDVVALRAAIEKSMAGFDQAGDALLKMENCVKDRLGPPGESLPTGESPSDGAGPSNANPNYGGFPDFGQAPPDSSTGLSGGEVHLFPSDGQLLTFQGVGEFIAVKSMFDEFEIQARQQPWEGSLAVSVNTAVAMNVAGDRVGIYGDATPALRLDGVPTTVGSEILQLAHGGQIRQQREGHYVIVWPDTTIVHVWYRFTAQGLRAVTFGVALPVHRRGKVSGLLGNFDMNPAHYPANRAGNVIQLGGVTRPVYRTRLYNDFGDSWRISQSASLFDYEPGEDTNTLTDRKFPYEDFGLSDLNTSQRNAAQAVCRQTGVSTPRFLEACTGDVAITGDPSFAETAAEVEAGLSATSQAAPAPIRPGGRTVSACELFTLADAQALSKSFVNLTAPRERDWTGTGRVADDACSYMEDFGDYLSVSVFRNPAAAMFSSSAFPNLRRVAGLGNDVYVSECGFPALIHRGDVLVAFGVAEFLHKDGYAPGITSSAGCNAWRGKVEALVRKVVHRLGD